MDVKAEKAFPAFSSSLKGMVCKNSSGGSPMAPIVSPF